MSNEEWIRFGTSSIKILDMYKSLIDSTVVEFFTKNLWSTVLPKCWQISLNNLNVCDLISILQSETDSLPQKVFPLSLIALKTCIKYYSLNRSARENVSDNNDFKPETWRGSVTSIPNEFKLHLSSKKQHEIIRTTETLLHLYKMCDKMEPLKVLDIGSGHGHLSRYLAGYHDLNVISVDADISLVTKANKFDQNLFRKLSKKQTKFNVPRLINAALGNGADDQIDEIFRGFEDSPSLLVGLHACGDLSVHILKEFIRNSNIFGVLSVGCCYMKITDRRRHEDINEDFGTENMCVNFPLSRHFKEHQPFSYFAKELACHANEQLLAKLKSNGNMDFLKIHCYRSILEVILKEKQFDYNRKPLKTIKNGHLITFFDYAKAVLKNDIDNDLSDDDFNSERVENCLKFCQNVVTFFILRQLLAPLVENVILTDRALFIKENVFANVRLFPVFDPIISARNIALMSYKL